MELICLSCYHLQGAQGLGVVMSLINALIENLWRAKQHLRTKLMLVVPPLFTLALTAACAACSAGTGTRLATAMHWNWWKFMKITLTKVTFLKLFDFSIKQNRVMRKEKSCSLQGCSASPLVHCSSRALSSPWGSAQSVGMRLRLGSALSTARLPGGISWYLRQFFPLLLRAGQVSPSEKDRSLNADSCSLKAEDQDVSRGLSRGDAAAESALYWPSGEGTRAEGTCWS